MIVILVSKVAQDQSHNQLSFFSNGGFVICKALDCFHHPLGGGVGEYNFIASFNSQRGLPGYADMGSWVFVCGGISASGLRITSCEYFDKATKIWQMHPAQLPVPIAYYAMVKLPGNRVGSSGKRT